ncbi:MAG: tyrosine--tRNA ligase [Nitrospiria bacterium]
MDIKTDRAVLDDVEAMAEVLTRGVIDIIQRAELVEKLEQSRRLGKPLIVKLGIDPTAPNLHLGHVVLFQKLKQFQDFGHAVVVLVGDFTGMIGDPSGRSEIRQPLTREAVLKNAESYQTQIFKILDPERTIIRYNSEWMDSMKSEMLIQLASEYTVARILERDDFQKRYQASHPIGVHEFLYPLIQGYDSVALRADVELGGTDQKFNLLVGRTLQKAYGQAQQVVLTMPLLEGTDGIRKMSKSYGNDIALEDAPVDMFGKTMSIRDELMWRYFELLTDEKLNEVKKMHPMEAKLRLAHGLVARFHGGKAAERARGQFDRTVGRETRSKTDLEIVVGCEAHKLFNLLFEQRWASSKGEARRLIQQGAVEINGNKIIDPNFVLILKEEDRCDIKIGKKKRYCLLRGD